MGARIFDAQGRVVTIHGAGRNGLDVGHLSSGHYVLRAIVNGGLISRPFVKE
ncbi:MAG: T9SS type A sorting domain-containing protein [Flavobacteriales bacterium]|nr:T9SS type A sorting domain-containing protein [Flavobacteriales bacterium]